MLSIGVDFIGKLIIEDILSRARFVSHPYFILTYLVLRNMSGCRVLEKLITKHYLSLFSSDFVDSFGSYSVGFFPKKLLSYTGA